MSINLDRVKLINRQPEEKNMRYKNIKKQVLFVNLGLSSTNSGNLVEMDQELARWIVETKFQHCGIVSEPYTSSWTDKEGREYTENCLAFRILVPSLHSLTVEQTQEKINSIRVLCKQEAVAFHTISPQGRHYTEVHYGPEQPIDALVFDSNHFHYVA